MEQKTIEIRELIASDGMVLTDGTTYAKCVYLAPSSKVDDWWEIPESEIPEPIEQPVDEYAQTEPEE